MPKGDPGITRGARDFDQPRSLALRPRRKCTTCKKPTNNYRCPECWAKLRIWSGDPTETYKLHWR
jgi:hypothetical protein